jgi:diadenosine tetraphosphatase ApaH/serine/threonine PP2A family protein phosphatase
VRVAVLSDIHGNWEALSTVFDDIDRRGIESVYCLGDSVGYGPDPERCLDWVRDRCSLVLLGNHEEALLSPPIGFHSLAREAIGWTRQRLLSPWPNPFRMMRYRRFLQSLPRQARAERCFLVHGSPRDPTAEYLLAREFLLISDEIVQEFFSFEEPVCFAGHTHMPCVFSANRLVYPAGEDGQEVPIEGDKLIVNVGSVGQPRDRDPRACYVEFTGDLVVYHRLSYDIDKTQAKILDRGLDGRLAERLAYGL